MRTVLSAAILALLMPLSVASAHMGSTKFVRVTVTDGGALVQLDIDLVDVAYELGMRSDPVDRGAVSARLEDVERWLAREVHVSADGLACASSMVDATSTERRGLPYLSVTMSYACGSEGALVFRDDAVFGDDAMHEALVRVEGIDGQVTPAVLTAAARELELSRPTSTAGTAFEFVEEGALHLLLGYDHLLFLLALLLVAGERTRRHGLRTVAKEVAWVVTGFTVGHSVTLIAAAMEWMTLPIKWVEAAIALSIGVVAVWNLLKPEAKRALPAVAVVFGLIHGFGFSNVLAELSLPTGQRVVALLSFNLGIELAQLAFVMVALVPLALMARRAWYRRIVLQAGSLAIALVSVYWVVERSLT